MLNNQRPIIYEDGQQLRDYVWVGDVAKADLLVLENDRADNNFLNKNSYNLKTTEFYQENFLGPAGTVAALYISGPEIFDVLSTVAIQPSAPMDFGHHIIPKLVAKYTGISSRNFFLISASGTITKKPRKSGKEKK